MKLPDIRELMAEADRRERQAPGHTVPPTPEKHDEPSLDSLPRL